MERGSFLEANALQVSHLWPDNQFGECCRVLYGNEKPNCHDWRFVVDDLSTNTLPIPLNHLILPLARLGRTTPQFSESFGILEGKKRRLASCLWTNSGTTTKSSPGKRSFKRGGTGGGKLFWTLAKFGKWGLFWEGLLWLPRISLYS